MSKLIFLSCAALSLLASSALVSSAAPNAAADDLSTMVDTLAKRVFNESDTNHNHVLNKNEFQQATAALSAAIEQWGRQGLIGQPKKHVTKDHATGAGASGGTSAAALAKSNKVSEAEFTFYAHGMVQDADQYWRQARLSADAQRKAMNAQRSNYRPRRPRAVYPYPYPY